MLTLLVGLSWASFSFSFSLFYLSLDNIGIKYLFFVIICAVVAGSVPILAAWTPAFYANTVPQIIAVPTVLLYSNSTINSFLAVSFVIYSLLLVRIQKRTNNTIEMTFKLKQKSEQLVSELNYEKEQREQLIEERTQELNQLLIEKTAIIENKLIGMVIVYERKIQWANSTFEQLLGYGKVKYSGV